MTNKLIDSVRANFTDLSIGIVSLVVLITLYSGWGQPFIEWANQYDWVKGIFVPENSLVFVLSFLSLAIIIIGFEYWYIFKRNGKLGVASFIILLFSFFVIFDNQYFEDAWTFRPLWKRSIITYFDIIGLIIGAPIFFSVIRYINGLKSKKQKNRNIGISDMPIENDEEDCLDRLSFADRLANHILELNAEACPVSIAVVAPWGSGKTSFINLLKNRWEKDVHNHYIVDFSPWHYSDGVNITKAFFEQLIAVVNPINVRLSTVLKRYLRVLSEIDIISVYNLQYFGYFLIVS